MSRQRLARVEKRLRALEARRQSPPEEGAEQVADMQFTLDVWRAYAEPGYPPPTRPLTRFEIDATMAAAYGLPPPAPPASAPPGQPWYIVEWQRTGRVAHPLLRLCICAATGSLPDLVLPDGLPPDPP